MVKIKKIGKHKVLNYPIHKLPLGTILDEPVDILFTDPPWGNRNVKYWKTMHRKQTGEEPSDFIQYNRLVGVFKNIIEKFVEGWVFMVGSVMYSDEMNNMLEDVLESYTEEELLYWSGGTKRPCMIAIGHTDKDILPQTEETLHHKVGSKVHHILLNSIETKRKVMLEPMSGKGKIASNGVKHGCTVIANEINNKRFLESVNSIEKAEF